ncbi:ABC transporter permease [Spirochaeta africana]|uniref:ABC-2 type transporter transmembrane domain-containing protein n=1 Tax=Spirochaeta africana (strain ATCC 700263 / DSM 8902 / Z-7692) TaxID=889378 RepID=H9UIZ7_SPIAZ|nr:ABC transporter permease [Spirochaeta africana]AFG37490.1 hypothetical protein Spiaf_1427 [Spirochaeta africana DSM 8902]
MTHEYSRSLQGCLAVARKELRSSFCSPVAYIVLVLFLGFTAGWLFLIEGFFARNMADLRPYFASMPFVLAVLVPAITMRLWAEEYRQGTYELLNSLPLRECELVIGKYLGALGVLTAAILLSLTVPLSLARLGSFDRGQLLSEYIGLLLLTGAATAIGSLVSSLARNQISAFLLGVAVLMTLLLVGYATAWAELSPAVRSLLQYISLQTHFHGFVRGVVDTRDLVYFGVLIVGALYLNTKVLILRKWGGS